MNAIVKTTQQVLVPQNFDQLVRFAEMAAGSDLMPRDYKGKPANIMLAVQMGSELGLAPMQALQSIAVINGRPGVWGDGMIGLCQQSPLCEDIREWIEGEGEARTAFCEAKRKNRASPVTGRFSVADAKKAGLWGKQGPWQQYPDRMLQNRARGFALRDAFPDLLRGLKTVEELRDYQDEKREPRPVDAKLVQQPKKLPTLLQPKAVEPQLSPREEMDRVLGGDSIPALDPQPEAERQLTHVDHGVALPDQPQDNASLYASRLRTRFRECQIIEDYNAIIGDPKVHDGLQRLLDKRPELWREVDAVRQEVLDAMVDQGAGGEP